MIILNDTTAYPNGFAEWLGELAEWLTELEKCRKQTEIIRCKDCRFYRMDDPKACGYHHCWRNKGVNIFPMKEDDFCSRGERKADKE